MKLLKDHHGIEDSQIQRMDKINLDIGTTADKRITLFKSDTRGVPLIVLNEFEDDGSQVVGILREHMDERFSLLCISELNWNHDLSPWECEALYRNEPPFTGGADAYLVRLTEGIIPKCISYCGAEPAFIGIAGYSLAGLFALYSMYKTDIFDRVASVSGSLWFPGFRDYVFENRMKSVPSKLYLSLGDKEAGTKNRILATVLNKSEEIVEYYRKQGMAVQWELNPGSHFKDAALRTAKGIMSLF